MAETIFDKIIRKEIPATVRYEDDDFLAFDDINPSAPVDVLIIPKKSFATLQDVPMEDDDTFAGLLKTVRKVAEKVGISDNYRLVMNVGDEMQQVKHVHIHLMGGWESKKRAQVKLKNI